jgi:hypothetical protein
MVPWSEYYGVFFQALDQAGMDGETLLLEYNYNDNRPVFLSACLTPLMVIVFRRPQCFYS